MWDRQRHAGEAEDELRRVREREEAGDHWWRGVGNAQHPARGNFADFGSMQSDQSKVARILGLYGMLMEETKVRLDTLREIQRLSVHRRIAYEFGQLLVRLVCEDIALACLVAHGEIEVASSRRLRKAWKPAEIMRMLQEAHPDFYPVPATPDLNEQGYIKGLLAFEETYLTKDKLQEYWSRAGNSLHRGTVDSLLEVPEVDFDLLHRFAVEVRGFLNYHHIALLDGQREIWVLMSEGSAGRVNVQLMQKTKS